MGSLANLILTMTIVVIALAGQGSTEVIGNSKLSEKAELELYRHRTRIMYGRLEAAGCQTSSLKLPQRRELISGGIKKQTEVEIVLLDWLTDQLIKCEKAKLRPTMTAANTTAVSNATAVSNTTTGNDFTIDSSCLKICYC